MHPSAEFVAGTMTIQTQTVHLTIVIATVQAAYLGAAETGQAVLPLFDHLRKPEVRQTHLFVCVRRRGKRHDGGRGGGGNVGAHDQRRLR